MGVLSSDEIKSLVSQFPETEKFMFESELPPKEDDGPAFLAETVPASLSENDIVNVVRFFQRENFPADPTYTITDDPFIQENPIFQENINNFIESGSAAESRAIGARIMRDMREREVILSSGALGLIASMISGNLSPTVLIPGGAGVRSLRQANKIRKLAILARAGASGAASAAISEGILQSEQEIRSTAESISNVSGSFLLSSLFQVPGAVRASRFRRLSDAITDDILNRTRSSSLIRSKVSNENPKLLQQGNRSAAEADEAVNSSLERIFLESSDGQRVLIEGGDSVVLGRLMKTLGTLSPQNRTAFNELESIRTASYLLVHDRLPRVRSSLPKSVRDVIPAQVKTWEWEGIFSEVQKSTREIFEGYKKRGGKEIRTFSEFDALIGKVLRRGGENLEDLAQETTLKNALAQIWNVWNEKLLIPMKRASLESGAQSNIDLKGTAPAWFTRMINANEWQAKQPQLIEAYTEHFMNQGLSQEVAIARAQDYVNTRLARMHQGRISGHDLDSVPESGVFRDRTDTISDFVLERLEVLDDRGSSMIDRLRRAAGDIEVSRVMGTSVSPKVRGLIGPLSRALERFDSNPSPTNRLELELLLERANDLDAAETLRQRLTPEESALADELESLIEVREQLERELFTKTRQLEGKIKVRERRLKRLETERATIRRSADEVRQQISRRKKRLRETEREISRIEKRIEGISARQLVVDDPARALRRTELRGDRRRALATARKQRQRLRQSEEKLDRRLEKLSDIDSQAKKIRNQRDRLRTTRQETRADLDEASGRIEEIRKETKQKFDDSIRLTVDRDLSDTDLPKDVRTRVEQVRSKHFKKAINGDLVETAARNEAQRLIDEARASGNLRKARRIEKRLNEGILDIKHIIGDLRHTNGLRNDPGASALAGGLRRIRQLNIPRLLGFASISSLVDVGALVLQTRLSSVLKTSSRVLMKPIRNAASLRPRKLGGRPERFAEDLTRDQEFIRQAALMDIVANFRQRQITELGEAPLLPSSAIGRGADRLTDAYFRANLLSQWTFAGKSMAGVAAVDDFLRILSKLVSGKELSKGQLNRIRIARLDDIELAREIMAEFDQFGAKGGPEELFLWTSGVDNWTNKRAADRFRSAVIQTQQSGIPTPRAGIRPRLFSTPTGKTVGQFMTFGLTTHNDLLLSGLARRDFDFAFNILTLFGISATAVWLKALARGEELDVEENQREFISRVLVDSGLFGVIPDGLRYVEALTGGIAGLRPLMTGTRAGRFATRNIVTDLVGPTGDLIESGVRTSADIFTATFTDKRFTRTNLSDTIDLFQRNSLFYLQRVLDAAERKTGDIFKLPETRRQ